MVFIVLHDFGIKPRAREPKFFSKVYKMKAEDAITFNGLCEQYGIERVEEEYPEWLMEFLRKEIIKKLMDLKENIRCANEIYPYYREEYIERRKYQDEAIRCCGKLYDSFTLVKEMLSINPDKYMSAVEKIERERDLLTGWRKSDNRIMAQIKKREQA